MVGYGSVGKRHISNLLDLGNTDIIVCTKRKKDNFLQKKDCKIYDSLSKCILEKPDAAIICNESSQHLSTALFLAKNGIHLFIEKPLSNSNKNIKNFLKIIKKRKIISLMGCPFRFHPLVKKTHQILNSKKLGKIFYIHVENGSYLPDWHPKENFQKSYASRIDLGGGVILTNIHELDYIHWYFGDPDQIYSISGNYSDLKITAEDFSDILMTFNKEKTMCNIHLDFFQKPKSRSCKIVGSKGTLSFDLLRNEMKIYNKLNNKTKKITLKNFESNSMYLEELKHFIHCIKKHKKSINDVEEGAQVLKLALMVKQAATKKRSVRLN